MTRSRSRAHRPHDREQFWCITRHGDQKERRIDRQPAENASDLRLFDKGLAIQLRRNNSFQIKMENSNTCRRSDVHEMTKAPVNITVTVNSGDSFLAVPLCADGHLTVRGNWRGVCSTTAAIWPNSQHSRAAICRVKPTKRPSCAPKRALALFLEWFDELNKFIGGVNA